MTNKIEIPVGSGITDIKIGRVTVRIQHNEDYISVETNVHGVDDVHSAKVKDDTQTLNNDYLDYDFDVRTIGTTFHKDGKTVFVDAVMFT